MLDDSVGGGHQSHGRRIEQVAVDAIVNSVTGDVVVHQLQATGVCFVLVSERAVFGGQHQRARLIAQGVRGERREIRIGQIGHGRTVHVDVVGHVLCGEDVVGAVGPHRFERAGLGIVIVADYRVKQHLRARHELAAVAGHERDGGRKIAARAVAKQHDAVGIRCWDCRRYIAPAGGGCRRSRLGVININRTTHPRNRQFPSKQLPGYLIAILNSSREAVFRSQPVLD